MSYRLLLFFYLLASMLCHTVQAAPDVHDLFNFLGTDLNAKQFTDFRLWRQLTEEGRNQRIKDVRKPIGLVLRCINLCEKSDSKSKVKVEYLSPIYLGDELQTWNGSYLWAMLFNGTLIRIAENSHFEFRKYRETSTKTFLEGKISEGCVSIYPRLGLKLKKGDLGNTSKIFLPLAIGQSNPEFYTLFLRKSGDQGLSKRSENIASIRLLRNSFDRLVLRNNKELEEHGVLGTRDHEMIVFTPNLSTYSLNVPIDILYQARGKGYSRAKGSHSDLSLDERAFSYKIWGRRFPKKNLSQRPGTWTEVDQVGEGKKSKGTAFFLDKFETITSTWVSLMHFREAVLSKYWKGTGYASGELIDQEINFNIDKLLKEIQKREKFSLAGLISYKGRISRVDSFDQFNELDIFYSSQEFGIPDINFKEVLKANDRKRQLWFFESEMLKRKRYVRKILSRLMQSKSTSL